MWLSEAEFNVKTIYPIFRIPNRFFKEYITNISELPIFEIKRVLRILLRGGTSGHDDFSFTIAPQLDEECKSNKERVLNYSIEIDERYQRMIYGNPAWEGLAWSVSLLPIFPLKVLNLIRDYIYAGGQFMCDDMLIGLGQASEIVEKRFIITKYPKELLTELKPVEFEYIINRLFQKMGYCTEWTKATRDGGKDIIATKKRSLGVEHIYIECKKYDKSELKNEMVKAFAYTVLNDQVTKGIIFCTGYVPKTLYNLDQRIKIFNYDELNKLLNSYWGDWVNSIEKELD